MLEPDSRSLLSDLLRPPPGFTLSHAVGTTFTLTLEAALAVPLSLAGSTATDDDAVGIISAVRRAVDRIDVFAQAGYVRLGAASDLVAVLEPMIHPVVMPHGLFHPKVWFLEFESGDERRYRFICSSRNLTTDRTWDAVVALDGAPASAPGDATESANAGMVRLLRWLADDRRSSPRLSAERRARIDELAESWRRIEWERPDHVRRMKVHAFGIPGAVRPSHDAIRSLIVSPFVTDDGLADLRARRGHKTILVSRPEQLDRLDPAAFENLSMRILDDYVDQALADAETQQSASSLSGLHAKVMVHDRSGGGSTLLIGSANATRPAWNTNIEVMIELDGPTKKLGVEVIADSLAPLLESYVTDGGATTTEHEEAEQQLDGILRRAAATPLTLEIHPDDPYSLSFWADALPEVPLDVELSWRLLTHSDDVAGGIPRATAPHRWGPVSLDQITPFIVITATDSTGRRAQCIVIAEIRNDIPGRGDAIVAAHLSEPGAFARFIRLMLQTAGPASAGVDAAAAAFGSGFGAGVAEDGSGLLELLVRASATSRDALGDIGRVLTHLSPEERERALPAGFGEIWASVMGAVEGSAEVSSAR